MTLAVNLANLANFVNPSGQLNAAGGLVNAVPLVNGGTGASDAATARTNLGVPSSTGVGATGSWPISVTGSAASATNATNAQFATTQPAGTNNTTIATTAFVQSSVTIKSQTVAASGAAVNFTNIPSGVQQILVTSYMTGFVTAGNARLRIGNGTVVATGYALTATAFNGSSGVVTMSSAADGISSTVTQAAASSVTGQFFLAHVGSNQWVCTSSQVANGDSLSRITQGRIALSGPLTALSFVCGASTFDTGYFNIQYI